MPAPLLIVVTGPTAAGKTAFSITLAKHFKTEIISADSRQFYREMEIGTAKPTRSELEQAPHHFINSHSIHDSYSAGKYETEALECIEKLFKKHDKLVMTGGSLLFINAVCEGLDALPQADAAIREKYNRLLLEQGIAALQQELKIKDPDYYKNADIHNPRRLIRALEVTELCGLPYSAMRSRQPKKRSFDIIKIGLKTQKGQLTEAINRRVDDMLRRGWLDECKKLYPYRHLNALQTVGYKEIFGFLDGKYNWADTVERIKIETRHYAKRQLTWLKREKDMVWFLPSQTGEAIQHIDAFAG